jgi:hypothetical protein
LLNSEFPSISVESFGYEYKTYLSPLLYLAKSYSGGFSSNFQACEKFNFLLGRGANVRSVDQFGQTCLHLILNYDKVSDEQIGGSGIYNEQEFQSILMAMVTAGADVHAVSKYGISVSDLAVCNHHEETWIRVLAACGYNPMEVFNIEHISSIQERGMTTFFAGEVSIRATKMSFEEYYANEQLNGFCGRSRDDEDWDALSIAEMKAIYGDDEESTDDESSTSHCEEPENSEFSDWGHSSTEENESVFQDDDYESMDGDPVWRTYIPRHRFLWYRVKVAASEDISSDNFDSCDEGDYTDEFEDEYEADYDSINEDEGQGEGASWNKLD